MKLAPLLAVAVPSLLVGGGLGWSLRSPSRSAEPVPVPSSPASGEDDMAVPAELSRDAQATAERASAAEPPSRTSLTEKPPGEAPETGLFSAALLAHARAGIESGWSQRRSDRPSEEEFQEGLEMFREATLEIPAGIGGRLADRRSEEELALEDARRGGVMVTLKRLEDGGEGPLMGVVRDRATFNQFFVSEHSSEVMDGAGALTLQTLKKREPVPDGSTLTFPAGVFLLQDFGSYWRDHFPRDLTLKGAGKSSTLLVLKQDLSAYDTVQNLRFENFTIHANNNYVFDIRQPSMSLTLKNVRVTGWDMGAGSSCLFGTEGLALRATNCDFLGGYGRAPEHGQLFDVRSNALLARFENCLIQQTEPFDHFGSGATVVFSACRIVDATTWTSQVPDNVLLDGTSLTFFDRSQGQRPPQLDLNDLFPGWKQSLGL